MTELLLKTFVKNYNDTSDKTVREGYGILGGICGIICNIVLFVIKLAAGIMSASVSVIADALNNLSDMASSVITLIGFKVANKPADKDHPFGHGRMEYMTAFIVSSLILLVGVELFKSSLDKILNPEPVEITAVTITVLIVSVFIKLWMFFFNRSLSKRVGSGTLAATAQDSLNDALTTTAILVSVAVILIFKVNIDAYMGIAMSLFILYSGIKSAKATLDPLLGSPPEPEMISELETIIMSFDGFIGIHDLIVHNYGPGRIFASVHIEVPQTIDIVRCHERVDMCEKLVAERLNIELVIHMDPIVTDDETVVHTRAELAECLTQIDPRLTAHDFRMTPKGENRTNLIFDITVPAGFDMTTDEIHRRVEEKMRELDPTFCFVITFDRDFSGMH